LYIFDTFDPKEPSVFMLFNLETIVSAGWDTIAHKIPAIYPEANVIPNWKPLEYSYLGFVKICL